MTDGIDFERLANRAETWRQTLGRSRAAAADDADRGLIERLKQDPDTLDFTRKLLETVTGDDDPFSAALGLREMAQQVPDSMPVKDRLVVRAGGVASLGLPWAIMPLARRLLRSRVSDVVLPVHLPDGDADAPKLAPLTGAVRTRASQGITTAVRPIGEAVHGPAAARREAGRLVQLAKNAEVRHIVVDPDRLAPGGTAWSIDGDVARAAAALRPVLETAAAHDVTVHLAPRSVRWARVVDELARAAVADPALDGVRIGVRLAAELPESREVYAAFARWAAARVAEGGEPSEVTIGVTGLAAAERIASLRSGLAVPVLEDPQELSAQLLRLAGLALHPGRSASLRPVIASEDGWVLAWVAERSEQLGTRCPVQLRAGLEAGLPALLATELPEVREELPVISPREYSGALDLIVGFAAEAAAAAGSEDPGDAQDRAEADAEVRDRGDAAAPAPSARTRFETVIRLSEQDPAPPRRTQSRSREWDPSERDSALFYRAPDETARFDTSGLTAAVLSLGRDATGVVRLEEAMPERDLPVVSEAGFAGEPDTDASLSRNRDWAREHLAAAARIAAERDAVDETRAISDADLAAVRGTASTRWNDLPHEARAKRLRRGALAVAAARDRLLRSLAVDTGGPIAEIDDWINEIIDTGRYVGGLTEGLASVRGATFVADPRVLVAADPRASIGEQAGAVLSALGAGSSVLWAVPGGLLGTAEALREEWEAAGLPAGAVTIDPVPFASALPDVAASPDISRAVVLGDEALAAAMRARRPGLRIDGRFAAPGSVLVAPSADIDEAVAGIVASAFRSAGSHARCVTMVVVMGGAARSKRLQEALADAVGGLRAGDAARPFDQDPLTFTVGPVPVAPGATGLRALTELGKGEQWLVRPARLDDAGRLWSPGVRIGVTPASAFWDEAMGLPVIGIVHAHSLEEAVSLQNSAGRVAAGVYSYDAEELLEWIGGIGAASLAINRPTTEARVEREPGAAFAGDIALAGGPGWLVPQGSWETRPGTRSGTLHLRGLEPEVRLLIEASQEALPYEEFDEVRRAALADALAWRTDLGVMRDTIGMGVDRHVLRHVPVPVHVRLSEAGTLAGLVRVVSAAFACRAPIVVSTAQVLPADVSAVLAQQQIEVSLERDDAWLARVSSVGPDGPDGSRASRVRLIGGGREQATEWLSGHPDVRLWAEPVTMAGTVELLTLVREQAISARAHRHGLAVPVPGLDELVAESA